MAASSEDMQDLHKIVAQSLNNRIKQDMKDDLPTDAATLGAAIKFLKDNEITADPADKSDLDGLREQFRKMSADRKAKASNVIDIVKQDLASTG